MSLCDISFAHREVVAPVGLWERGAGASGYIPPSARLFPKSLFPTRPNFEPTAIARNGRHHRASKADATSPSGETQRFQNCDVKGEFHYQSFALCLAFHLGKNGTEHPRFKSPPQPRSNYPETSQKRLCFVVFDGHQPKATPNQHHVDQISRPFTHTIIIRPTFSGDHYASLS